MTDTTRKLKYPAKVVFLQLSLKDEFNIQTNDMEINIMSFCNVTTMKEL